MDAFGEVHALQSAAGAVMRRLAATITAVDTERSIVARAVACLEREGIDDTWYYECPALVLLGSRSCESVSGGEYVAADEPVGQRNLVTVDLSPRRGEAIGDYARSLCVEDGYVGECPRSPDLRHGVEAAAALHRHLTRIARPETTFAELYELVMARLTSLGYESLDARGNFGHTLTGRLQERRFIEADSPVRLADAGPFTFEPHIRRLGGRWGFKQEDVYVMGEDGAVLVL